MKQTNVFYTNTHEVMSKCIMTHTNLSESLAYNIYHRSNHNKILFDGSGNTSNWSKSYKIKNSSRTHDFTIYGKIPVQTMANVGLYTDTIIATLTY